MNNLTKNTQDKWGVKRDRLIIITVMSLIIALLGTTLMQSLPAFAQETRHTLTVTVNDHRGATGPMTMLEGARVSVYAGSNALGTGSQPYDINDPKDAKDVRAKEQYHGYTNAAGTVSLSLPANTIGYWVAVTETPDGHYPIERIVTGDAYSNMTHQRGYAFHTGGIRNYGTNPPDNRRVDQAFSKNMTIPIVGSFPTNFQGGWNRSHDINMGGFATGRINPAMSNQVCEGDDELNITIMADLSNSTSEYIAAYRRGLANFVDSIAGEEGMKVRLRTFAGDAPAYGNSASTEDTIYDMTNNRDVNSLRSKASGIRSVSAPSSGNRARAGTNWEDAFEYADTNADLLLFVTDGMPTIDRSETANSTTISYSRYSNVESAIAAANDVKASGTRIAAVGVGAASQSAVIPNLKAISGPVENTDYFRPANWDQLGQLMTRATDLACNPAYEFTKESDPVDGSVVNPGDEIHYTITGTNAGDVPLEIDVEDDMSQVLNNATIVDGSIVGRGPDGTDSNGYDVPVRMDGTRLYWELPLNADQSFTIDYTVKVNEGAYNIELINRANSSARPLGTPIGGVGTITTPEVSLKHRTEGTPGFDFIKDSDPVSGTLVNPGEEVTYTVSGMNTGDTPLDVFLDDDLTKVLNYATLVDGPNSNMGDDPVITDGLITWDDELLPGETVDLTYTVRVNDDSFNVLIENIASGFAVPPSGTPITPDDSFTEHPTPGEALPNIDITKYINDEDANTEEEAALLSSTEDTMEVSYTITNTGDTVLNNVTLTDNIPEINDALTGYSVDGVENGSISLEPNESVIITLEEVASPAIGDRHHNIGTVTGMPDDPRIVNPSPVTNDDPAHAFRYPENAVGLPNTGSLGMVSILIVGGLLAMASLAWAIIRRKGSKA